MRDRLNDTYDRIAKESKRADRPRAGRRRRATAVAAAEGVLGVGLFASAFVSPAMADTINNIPVLGSLFSSIQSDIGLRAAGEAHPNTLVFEQVMESGAPDAFDAAVTFKLDGIDHEFTLDVPFRQTAGPGIELSPNLAKSSDDLTFTLTEVRVTPVTTRLKTSIAMDGKDALTTKEERRLFKIGVAVYDDQGRRLPALNGEGIIEGNRLVYDRVFATTPGAGEYLVVKPFVIEDDFAEDVKTNQFLDGLETKVELK